MRLTRTLVPALLVFATACGGDLVGPDREPLVLEGEWQYTANDLTGMVFGEGVDCDYRFEMTLMASGDAFDGIYQGALLTCTLFGELQPVDGGSGDIVAGSRNGTAIQFDVDTERIRNIGILDNDGMSGDVSIELIVQRHAMIDTITVVGTWNAFR